MKNFTLYKYLILSFCICLMACSSGDKSEVTTSKNEASKEKKASVYKPKKFPNWVHATWPKIVSASFEYDNKVPAKAEKWAKGASGKDGILLTLSHNIDISTLSADHFTVITKNKTKYKPEIATFSPAEEHFETRAVWLYGLMGNNINNPPSEIFITGELKSQDGQRFYGEKISVDPIKSLPKVVNAEYFTYNDKYPHKASGKGCDCPKNKTKWVLQTMWNSPVKSMKDEELGNESLEKFKVMAWSTDNKLNAYTPFQFGDLNDDDNFVDLCFDDTFSPVAFEIEANTVMDHWRYANKKQKVQIKDRWR